MRYALVAFLVCAAGALAGCEPKLIPGTDLRDTKEDREILDVIGTYRNAMETRNSEAILKLVASNFFETSGSPEGNDNFDRVGLQAKLKTWTEKASSVRVAIEVKQITFEGDQAKVRYFFDANFQIPGPNNTQQWKRETDTKEMLLRREDKTWKIVSGI
jgi:hypothetical protein